MASLQTELPEATRDSAGSFRRDAWLLAAAWFGTTLILSLDFPFSILLKDTLKLRADELALFFFIARIPIYIKPIAGIISDSYPIFGTRRRHYLLLSLLATGMAWLLLGIVPKQVMVLLAIYMLLMVGAVMSSTVLGGWMVEVGQRFNATGRLSAQRVGITRVVGGMVGPLSGFLASIAFFWSSLLGGALAIFLGSIFFFYHREPSTAQRSRDVWKGFISQVAALFHARTLWAAAGLVVLVIIAPGFGTPLFYYQIDELGFSKQFMGNLGLISAAGSMLAAVTYGWACRRWGLRTLLIGGIIINGLLTLLYMNYESRMWAMIITATESISGAWAILPLYDLAARATPRGSEALGYSLMMSVWNFTGSVSDFAGAWMFSRWGLTLHELIWVNVGTTLSVVLIVPFLSAALLNRRDGD